MTSPYDAQISFSFMELRKLLDSFSEVEGGCPQSQVQETAIYQLVDHLGDLAMPVLLRKLFANPDSGRWASLLLLRLAQDADLKERIYVAVREQSLAPTLPDRCKLLAANLLATLSGYQEELPCLSMPEETAELSLVELADCIRSRADVARAVDILIDDMPPLELVEFIEDFVSHVAPTQPSATQLMLQELLLRDDLDYSTRVAIRRIGASLASCRSEHASDSPEVALRLATHPDGSTALVSYSRIPGQPQRYRALAYFVDSSLILRDCQYLEAVTRSEVDRQLLHPLLGNGYDLAPIGQGAAKQHAVTALHGLARCHMQVPRDYYLGRDLLGLFNEHDRDANADAEHAADAALLARGTELLHRGDLVAARELLSRYVALYPDDSESLTALGTCLMNAGELEGARALLEKAAQLAPRVGRYQWNQASLAHQEGRLGDCFLALQEFLACADAIDTKQRSLAESFVAQYQVSQPGAFLSRSTLRVVPRQA